MSGSIFRRGGQKAEAHGAPAEQEISTDVLESKLSDLQAAWSAPLIAASQSLAVWHSSSQAAEVTIERGHVLQRMGYKSRKKLFLHIEEAVYLLSKGSLLLTLFDAEGQHQLLSLQEATELMESCGVSIAQYQVYTHLMRAGYIVTRHPATWVLDNPQHLEHMAVGNNVIQEQLIPESKVATGKINIPDHILQVTGRREDNTAAMPPWKKAKFCAEPQSTGQMHRQWWSPASACPAWSLAVASQLQNDLARFVVQVDHTDSAAGLTLPHLRLLSSIPQAAPNEVVVPDDLKLVYDVLKPNKLFRRGSPDDPRLVVCLATGSNVPSFGVIQHLQQQISPLPLQFARVAGGQVSFHSMQNSS